MAAFGGSGFGQQGGFPLSNFGNQTPATNTTMTSGFNFGSFGTPAASTTFSAFGKTPATSTTTMAPTGFSGFGGTTDFSLPAAKVAATAPFGGGFGSPIATTTTTAGANMFGTSSTSTNITGFGFSGFGSNTATTTANTGFTFGGGLNTGLNIGGTSTLGGTQPLGLFGKPNIDVTSQAGDSNLSTLTSALFCPVLYGDERDTIIAKWNQLQAFWGTGKGYYSLNSQPVEFTFSNPFCRFKAIGYSCLPSSKNEDGFVSLIFNRKDVDVRAQQHQLVESLQRLFGNRPTLLVCVEGLKPAVDNKSEVTIYVLERLPTGSSRRIPASEVHSYFTQPNARQQLQMLGVEGLVLKAAPTAEQLRKYLENPPCGIDPLLWQQAQLDNPDPERLIPVPMVGFCELQRRLKCQEEETKVHQGRLNMISSEISTLQNSISNTEAKIRDHMQKHLDLSRRILKVMVRQEIGRKLGLAVQANEEQLKAQLETIHTELSAPNQAKGRLNELMSQIRLQKEHMMIRANERYSIDPMLQDELKQHLKRQQDGMAHLISIIRVDLDTMKLIEDGLHEETRRRK